jgi:hypothetical protein
VTIVSKTLPYTALCGALERRAKRVRFMRLRSRPIQPRAGTIGSNPNARPQNPINSASWSTKLALPKMVSTVPG